MSCPSFLEPRVAVREWMIRGTTAAEWFHQCLSSPTSDRPQFAVDPGVSEMTCGIERVEGTVVAVNPYVVRGTEGLVVVDGASRRSPTPPMSAPSSPPSDRCPRSNARGKTQETRQ